jgi:thymidylate kinase
MGLIILEGDNGAGKDTIAGLFEKEGYFIPTYEQEARIKEQNAKTLKGISRISAFLEYNKFCGDLSMHHKNSLIVRYWTSTIAASYADGVLTMAEAIKKAHDVYDTLPQHDFIICLKCEYYKRINRIQNRRSAGGSVDDNITIERDNKYQEIQKEFESFVPHWVKIDTSDKRPEVLFEQILNIIGKKL